MSPGSLESVVLVLWAQVHHGPGELQCMWQSNPLVLTSLFCIALSIWGPSFLCSFPVTICLMGGERSSFGKWLGSLSVRGRCQWYEQTHSGVVAVPIVLLAVHV